MKIIETVVSSNWETDQESDRNYEYSSDRLAAIWQRTTLLIDRAVQFATAKTYVISDSVPCLGGISSDPVGTWENKIQMVY